MKSEILLTENRGQAERKPVASGWRLLILLPVVAALAASYVTYTVARIEDKYLEGHRVFMDPLHYQLHLFHLWELSKTKSRFDLVLEELSVPAEDGNITQIAFRTIPIILLNPDWLKSPHAQLVTSGFALFVFLWLLAYTVYRRTNRLLYALATLALACSIPGIYDPFAGMGAFWLDLCAGFLGAAAMLCLICSESGEKLVWLAGFAFFAACTFMSRFVSGPYLFIQAAPIFCFYFWRRWRRRSSFRRGVLPPILLIGGILFLLVGWYVWKLTPAEAAYNILYSYGYKDIFGSAYQVLDTAQRFFGLNFLLFCIVVFVVHLVVGFRSAWRTLAESFWAALSVGLFLTVTCVIGESTRPMQYSVPIILIALLCPFDWRDQEQRRSPQARTILLNGLGLVILVVAGVTLIQNLRTDLWRPAKPWNVETYRKALTDTLTDKIMRYLPDKVVGAYFDLFNEYAFVIAFERYGRFPRMFAPRAFDVRDQYLKLNYPGNKSPEEFAAIAWREASENCDVVLVFNDPATAFTPTPFDYGWCLNTYTETIASKIAETVRTSPHWKKLFVVPSPCLPGGVAAYANLDRFPEATEITSSSP
jgi:hypothetical protein